MSSSQPSAKRPLEEKSLDNSSWVSVRPMDSVDKGVDDSDYDIWAGSGELLSPFKEAAAAIGTGASSSYAEALERTIMGHEDFRARLMAAKAKRIVQIKGPDAESDCFVASQTVSTPGKLSKRLQSMIVESRANTISNWPGEDSQEPLLIQPATPVRLSSAEADAYNSLMADSDVGLQSVEELRRQNYSEALVNCRIEEVVSPEYRGRLAGAGSDIDKVLTLLDVLQEKEEVLAHERKVHAIELERMDGLTRLLESVVRTRDQTIEEKNVEVSRMTGELLKETRAMKVALQESIGTMAEYFKPSVEPTSFSVLLNRKGVLFTCGSYTEAQDPADASPVTRVRMLPADRCHKEFGAKLVPPSGARPSTTGKSSSRPRTKEDKLVRLASTLTVTPVDRKQRVGSDQNHLSSLPSATVEVSGSYTDGVGEIKEVTQVLRQLRREIASIERHN